MLRTDSDTCCAPGWSAPLMENHYSLSALWELTAKREKLFSTKQITIWSAKRDEQQQQWCCYKELTFSRKQQLTFVNNLPDISPGSRTFLYAVRLYDEWACTWGSSRVVELWTCLAWQENVPKHMTNSRTAPSSNPIEIQFTFHSQRQRQSGNVFNFLSLSALKICCLRRSALASRKSN